MFLAELDRLPRFSAKALARYLWGQSCLGFGFLFAGAEGFRGSAFPCRASPAPQASPSRGREYRMPVVGSCVTPLLSCFIIFVILKCHSF